MYLKRLELRGFKSFASQTVFEFGPGVTCIVGPNGAGKTNVAEAIRWVLGEQASRTIRARKTEDVIFSGSANRPAVGMGEVAIGLDNGDRWLPLEFSEVVVSRRAYRSGENEYYVNQSRVRLKDVTELFLKAQVGQNSYAFMGQGLVEEVLTLRPEDRRGLLEEAADVRLHRAKLDEARSRLVATRENLERVSLLAAEIEPRLRQLERQAGRAETHARLSAELAQALQAWLGEQWQQAQEALAAGRAACDQRQEAFDRARRELAACEEGVTALAGAIEESRRDTADRQEAYRRLEEYRRDLQQRIALDDERAAMLSSRQEELAVETESLRAERETAAAAVSEHEMRARALEEELAAARVSDPREHEAQEAETRLQGLHEAHAEAQGRLAEAHARLAETEAKIAALTSQRERLSTELASLEAARGEQLPHLKAWARELALRRYRVNELAPAVERTTGRLAEAEARLNETSTRVSQHQEQVHSLSVQIESAQARLEAASTRDVELPAPDAGIRALLAAGGLVPGEEPDPDGRIHGMVGMLGQLLRVPAGLERAVEAALAESLHAVVVESHDDALAAVELLVSEDLGHATILPLGDIRPTPPLNLLEERGVVGVASELVRCDHRFRPLVNALLGRTIVVQNLGVAKTLLRRGLGNVVTRDGILLRPMGSITAGGARAIRVALGRQRDAGKLPGELERLLGEQRDAAAALETSRLELTEAQQARGELTRELQRLRADLTQAEDALRRQRGRLPALSARLSSLRARRQETQRALSETGAAIDAGGRDAGLAHSEADRHESALERLRQQVEALTSGREERLRAASERAARLAALEAEQQGLARVRANHDGALARTGQELARRQELSARLEEELRSVRGRVEVARRELDEKSREAEGAVQELEPARRALEQIESRQRTMNEELATARSRTMAAERALLEAEATVRLRGEEIDALRDRLEEEGFRPSPEGVIVPATREGQPPAWLTTERGAADDEVPPVHGGAGIDPVALKERIGELRSQIRALGPVNEQAQADYTENRERYEYLTGQLADLRQAEASIQDAIQELERIIKERFSATFHQVNQQFQRYFETFFGGGHAELVLTKPDEHGLAGVDIVAQPPRKRVRTLHMLSGGERSLTAVALLFALLQIHPSPICVLDEVDAALDEANVGRFTAALRELAERTQFIIITHNRRTIEMADTIYGVAMGEDSVSSVLSLRLNNVADKMG